MLFRNMLFDVRALELLVFLEVKACGTFITFNPGALAAKSYNDDMFLAPRKYYLIRLVKEKDKHALFVLGSKAF